ncbi:hypothetical protein ACRWD3_27200, partial [Escherichia coli]
SSGAGRTADRNRSHWSTSKTPSYTKSVSWQHHRLNYIYSAAINAYITQISLRYTTQTTLGFFLKL